LDREHDIGCAQYNLSISLDSHCRLAIGVVGEFGPLARARLHNHRETRGRKLRSLIWYQSDAPLALQGLRKYSNLDGMKL
jgi:hypothetical protein